VLSLPTTSYKNQNRQKTDGFSDKKENLPFLNESEADQFIQKWKTYPFAGNAALPYFCRYRRSVPIITENEAVYRKYAY
jgi:hypothetical protein